MCRESVRYIYIMSSLTRVLYTGSTTDLRRRVYQHRHGLIPGFTREYSITRLVYFESTNQVRGALERERQIKGWRREKKLKLIESVNAGWLDLAADWYSGPNGQGPSLRSG